jgi:Ca2+/Na+ antiporter
MNLEFIIYLVGNIDSISNWLVWIGFILMFAGVILLITRETRVSEESCEENKIKYRKDTKYIKRYIKVCIIIGVCFSLIAAILPNSETLAAIILIPSIIKNEKIIDTSNKIYEILNLKLDSWINEFKVEAVADSIRG